MISKEAYTKHQLTNPLRLSDGSHHLTKPSKW